MVAATLHLTTPGCMRRFERVTRQRREQPEGSSGLGDEQRRRTEKSLEQTQIRRFGPGESALDLLPGDFILTHGSSSMGKVIRVGERLRFRGPDRKYTRWNHVALLVDSEGGLIEADEGGVHRAQLSKYAAVEYYLVRIQASDEERAHAVQFADWSLHQSFGWLNIISIALSLMTGVKLDIGLGNQETCSSLVARALEHAGKIMETDPARAMPADLAKQYHVEPPAADTPITRVPDAPENVESGATR